MNEQKMIMIPAWRYEKMVESYDKAILELDCLKNKISELEHKSNKESKTWGDR